jgi:Insecticide toxin TcdB middle/N-terminal region
MLASCPPPPLPPRGAFDPIRLALLFADVNATGVDDLVIVTGFGTNCVVSFTGGHRPGLLSKISNGLGVTTSFEYDTVANLDKAARDAGKPWNTTLPVPAQVVTRVTTTNGLQGPLAQAYEADYAYADPIYDTRDRAFLGFREVTVTRPGDSAAPGTRTRTKFLTATCPKLPEGGPCDQPAIDYVYRVGRGLPGVVEVMDDAGTIRLISAVYTYPHEMLYRGLDGRVVRRAWREATDVYVWDPTQQDSTPGSVVLLPGKDPALPPLPFGTVGFDVPKAAKHLRQTAHFDPFGNATMVIDWGEVDESLAPLDKPIVTASSSWSLPFDEATKWAYRPLSQTIGYGDRFGNINSASRQMIYTWNAQALPHEIKAVLHGTAPLLRYSETGGAVAPTPSDASVDGTVTRKTLGYDAFGNVRRVQSPNGRCADIVYDPRFHQLPVSTVAYRDGCGSADPLVTSREFDRGIEAIVREEGPGFGQRHQVRRIRPALRGRPAGCDYDRQNIPVSRNDDRLRARGPRSRPQGEDPQDFRLGNKSGVCRGLDLLRWIWTHACVIDTKRNAENRRITAR